MFPLMSPIYCIVSVSIYSICTSKHWVFTCRGLLGHAVGSIEGEDWVFWEGFLGHVISFSGTTAVTEQVEVTLSWPWAGSASCHSCCWSLCRSVGRVSGAHLAGGKRRSVEETDERRHAVTGVIADLNGLHLHDIIFLISSHFLNFLWHELNCRKTPAIHRDRHIEEVNGLDITLSSRRGVNVVQETKRYDEWQCHNSECLTALRARWSGCQGLHTDLYNGSL